MDGIKTGQDKTDLDSIYAEIMMKLESLNIRLEALEESTQNDKT